jgi:hypothetical protein
MSEMPTTSTSPGISDIIRKVTKDIEDGKPIREQAATEVVLPDPSPSAVDVHREKLGSIIDTACAVALDNGRVTIERQHALMRAVQAKRDTVKEVTEDYLRLVQAVTDHTVIIGDALGELERQFSPTVVFDPPPGKPTPKGNGRRV